MYFLIALAVLLVAFIFFLIIIHINAYKYEILYYDVNDEIKVKQDNDFKGVKIIFFSDLHLGLHLKEKELRKIVNTLKELDGDVYIFGGDLTGDFILNYYDENKISDCFAPLKDKVCLSIYGNHEFKVYKHSSKDYTEKVINLLKAMNFKLLDNESYHYQKDDIEINFIGLQETHYHPLEKVTLADKNNIILVHQGDTFDEIDGSYLMISGHSHGGQIKLPIYYTPKNGKKYLKGHYHQDNKDLIVSKGLGCNLIKARFRAKCDIVVLDYERK